MTEVAVPRVHRANARGTDGKFRAVPLEIRFWDCVLKTPTCWLWTGVRVFGYGQLRGYGKAHRYSYELHIGPIPEGLSVLHKCDNPPCVRPDHLFVGTDRDNILDSVAKGRYNADGKRWATRRANAAITGRPMTRSVGRARGSVNVSRRPNG